MFGSFCSLTPAEGSQSLQRVHRAGPAERRQPKQRWSLNQSIIQSATAEHDAMTDWGAAHPIDPRKETGELPLFVYACKMSNLRGMGVASSVLSVSKETAVMIRTNITKHDLWDSNRMRVICLVWPFTTNCTAQMGPRGEILHWLELTKADTHISCCLDCMYSRQRNENNVDDTNNRLFSFIKKK